MSALLQKIYLVNAYIPMKEVVLSRSGYWYWKPECRLQRQLFAFLLVLLSAGFSTETPAQDSNTRDSTVVYAASYFQEYAPVTAQDMLNRIPGVSATSGGSVSQSGGGGRGSNASRGGRGLGSGGGSLQIMINGKRTAGKTNNSETQLTRISADQVNYIEIIRGTGGDLDVRGSTQVVNVVLFEQLSKTSISYELNMARYDDGEHEPGASMSYGGQAGDLNFLVSASAVPQYDHQVLGETSILADLAPNDQIREHRIREQTTWSLSTNLDYKFSDTTSGRVNALYTEDDNPSEIDRLTVDLRGGASTPYRERENIPGTQDNWEIGGDLQHKFANGNRFKLIGVSNENNIANTRERFAVLKDGTENKDLYLDSESTIQERIVRGSYTMDVFSGQDIEFGVERAQTILDSSLALGLELDTGTPSPAFGGLVPVEVLNANTRVEEVRYEPFVFHNWQINPKISLETSLVYEFSEITQSGDFSNKREFSYFKPKIDFRFDITPTLQLRLLLEKYVRQISFYDFVAATDNEDNDSNTQAGNTGLTPDYWWNYNFTAEYRLPDDAGVVSANFFFHHHKDFLERIDVSPSDDDLRSAAGNIGTGDMWVLYVKASVRLGMFKLPNILVTSRWSLRDSVVRDPFLGTKRSFTNYPRGQFDIGIRHDLPRWKMNYGFNWNNQFDADIKRYDIDDIESLWDDPYAAVFVEKVTSNKLTFRVDVKNATDSRMCRERERYVGRISANILEEVEHMCRGSGPVYSLKVSGTL